MVDENEYISLSAGIPVFLMLTLNNKIFRNYLFKHSLEKNAFQIGVGMTIT